MLTAVRRTALPHEKKAESLRTDACLVLEPKWLEPKWLRMVFYFFKIEGRWLKSGRSLRTDTDQNVVDSQAVYPRFVVRPQTKRGCPENEVGEVSLQAW